jgi:hypothetical protein
MEEIWRILGDFYRSDIGSLLSGMSGLVLVVSVLVCCCWLCFSLYLLLCGVLCGVRAVAFVV